VPEARSLADPCAIPSSRFSWNDRSASARPTSADRHRVSGPRCFSGNPSFAPARFAARRGSSVDLSSATTGRPLGAPCQCPPPCASELCALPAAPAPFQVGSLPDAAKGRKVPKAAAPRLACGYRVRPTWSLAAVVDKSLPRERIVPGVAAIRVASSRVDRGRCLSRYAQNHTGPTRMQPRERQSDGRWA
jgi:hypothetical protein